MATLEDYNKYITVFYFKNNYKIKLIVSGIQNMNVFGNNSDLSSEIEFQVMEKPKNPINNISNYKYDAETKSIIKRSELEIADLRMYGKILTENEYLDEVKIQKTLISKTLLSEHLQNNPILFSDGKYYSVTQEKQNLLNNAITVYQMKTQLGLPAELKWNSTGEECSVWTIEDIIPLALGVASYVEPLVAYQQSIEIQIRNCSTREELESIVINYETV